MDNRPLGFFDSGVGGLSVLAELRRCLPHEDVVYFADTAHLPYGDKSASDLLSYGRYILDFMLAQETKAVVVACNTATAMVLGDLKALYHPLPLVGMIQAGARAATQTTVNHRIGVIGTWNVVRSAAYTSYIQNEDYRYQVFERACPGLVPLVEAGIVSGVWVRREVMAGLQPLLRRGIDTLVLGCTHYPFMEAVIREVAGSRVTLVDPAAAVVAQLHRILRAAETLHAEAGEGAYAFYVSGDAEAFRRTAQLLFPGWTLQVRRASPDRANMINR